MFTINEMIEFMNKIKTYAGEISSLGPKFLQESEENWLNCGDLGGYALGALRMGNKHILFDASSPVYSKIIAIAAQYDAHVRPIKES
ncbi:hypothetical protein IM40_01950 [Candidatus Paracaedimonas acanthamoebae]|nr:hypothetical protein IM40_01950 [Candidatus Paracaedimonas acanthamoebae]